jgi:hypothetical protein
MEHTAEQTNLYAKQKIHGKTLLNKMKSRQHKYWIPKYKDEMKLLFGILLLQGNVQKPKMGDYFFSKQTFSNTYILWKYVRKEIFFFV